MENIQNEDFANAGATFKHITHKSNKCMYIYIIATYGQFVLVILDQGGEEHVIPIETDWSCIPTARSKFCGVL